MTGQIKRLLFVNVNKYQQKILIPALIICLLACSGAFYALYYVYYLDQNIAVVCHIDSYSMSHAVPWFIRMHSFNKVVPWIIFGVTTALLIILCWLFWVSNKMLGPSVRVLQEMDDVLSGKRTDPIGTRNGDEFFEEMLLRINALIKKSQ